MKEFYPESMHMREEGGGGLRSKSLEKEILLQRVSLFLSFFQQSRLYRPLPVSRTRREEVKKRGR